MSLAKVGIFLRSAIWNNPAMNQAECVSCNGAKSIYGQICNDRLVINGYIKDNVQLKSGDALKCPKPKKKKKIILSTLDILFSVFIVTPLVVACWRGTWQLMDIYFNYFPPWESFLIGTSIHIIFAISQDSFHEVLNRKYSSSILNGLVFLVMKLYTIVFNGVTNMHWRGAWVIADDYFGISYTETGEAEIEDGRGAVLFYTVCFLTLFFMKSLRNINAPPFELCLDYGDDMFLFPSMFKVKLTVIATVSTKLHVQRLEISENTSLPVLPLRSISKDTIVMLKNYPTPLQNRFHGQRPTSFTVTSTTTEHPLYSPRFFHKPYKIRYYPKSIQEIIGQVTPLVKIEKVSPYNESYVNHRVGKSNYQENSAQGFKRIGDRFREYKPVHPGEINLMAMANFRFAPAVWKSYSAKYQRTTLAQQFLPSAADSSKPTSEIIDVDEPISVTFKVMPRKENKDFLNFLRGIKTQFKNSKDTLLTVNLKVAPDI